MNLHPSGFIETGDCAGARYVRSQPNRESAGLLLDNINKYVTEFDLPFQSTVQYFKQIENNWDRLSDAQKNEFFTLYLKDNPKLKQLLAPPVEQFPLEHMASSGGSLDPDVHPSASDEEPPADSDNKLLVIGLIIVAVLAGCLIIAKCLEK